jgi:hypothetical protein
MLSDVHNHCHLQRNVSTEDRATAVRYFARMIVWMIVCHLLYMWWWSVDLFL